MKSICVLLVLWALPARSQSPPAPTQPPASAQNWSWFWQGGTTGGNNLSGGLGVAMDVAAGQQIFGEFALETGSVPLGQATNLLIGVKSNYPQITAKGRKWTPFSIVGYGASIDTLKSSHVIPSAPGLSASTITQIGTSAGFAQQYGAGFQTVMGSWNIGFGASGDKSGAGWKGYPFVFVSKVFGK